MIDYVIFEKKEENERPPWTIESVKEFCQSQKIETLLITEELQFIVVKVCENPEEGTLYRLLEVTETISFLIRDDPSLNEFLEFAVPTSTPTIENLTLEEQKVE